MQVPSAKYQEAIGTNTSATESSTIIYEVDYDEYGGCLEMQIQIQIVGKFLGSFWMSIFLIGSRKRLLGDSQGKAG